jgi:glycosyltransferase involved in cell wall biosynthesis
VSAARPRIGFFDYADVFEDFYPHYGVDQHAFATTWAATSNHAFLSLLQREVGDVSWYELALRPELRGSTRHALGFDVRVHRSSAVHRLAWTAYYRSSASWRWPRAYRPYAALASWTAPLSAPLVRAVRQDRPRVLFAQSWSSGKFDVLLGLARALRVPLVAYHAGGDPDAFVGAAVRRRTLPGADLLLASSSFERDRLTSAFGVAPGRVRVVLTPVDTSAFRPTDRGEACRLAGLDPSRRYLLFVGRLSDREKRVGALIDAFARELPRADDVDLLVAGDGKDAPALRRLAASAAPGRVRFLGWASGTDALRALYNAADCLVLPSPREGFPTVVGEAAACGTPVLASRVGGVPELVVDGVTGWLFEPEDDVALAARIALVLERPDEVRALRPAARAAAEARVAPEVVGPQLREAFGAVLAR